jgi:hypothetical protein
VKVECFGWEAWYDKMPGKNDPDLHVAGTCRVMSSSTEVSLELGDVGVVPEPGVVALQLEVVEAEFGDDLVTEKSVSWSGDVGPDIEKVRIQGDTDTVEVPVKEVV